MLRWLCFGNESYLSLLRIALEVELLPLYNQRHYMAATWLKTNNMLLNDWKTTRTLFFYQPTKDELLWSWTRMTIPTKWTHQLTTNKLTKNSNVTRLLRFKANLLNLCLTSTSFQYNGKHYKQLHGTAMGSPVSVVVAEIVMQNIEESALSTCRQTIPLWLRYVDDTFTAIRHDEIDAFHHHLTNKTLTYSLLERSKKMVNYLL